jgi:phosphoglycolate phosphatase
MIALGVPGAEVDRAVALYRDHFAREGMFDNRLYDGIPELLGELGAAGVRAAVATSKLTRFAVAITAHFGLADHFEVVLGATEGPERRHKTAIVAETLRRLGGPPAAAMVGDRRDDMAAAAAHGLRAVGVTWGYGSVEELTAAGAEALPASPAELGRLLLGG